MSDNGLRQLGPSTWVLESPTNIGFILLDSAVYLVDSGNDKEAGRKINKILKERNWTLRGIISTHGNADHIGGNDYLQRSANCRIFASSMERPFLEHPRLEAAFLWGGMEARDLRNKFFLAKPSKVTDLVAGGDSIEDKISIHSLPGHYFDMIGVESPDGVFFLADSLFGEDILEKYGIPFIFDVGAYKETIANILKMNASYYVPSHGKVTDNVYSLAESNLKIVEKMESDLEEILQSEMGFDNILAKICDINGIQLSCAQFALVGSTVRSFLSYLYNEGRIGYFFEKNIMIWQTVQ